MRDSSTVLVEMVEFTPEAPTPFAFWLFVAILAWVPFPLGSNRPWAANLLSVLVALCWSVLGAGTWGRLDRILAALRPIRLQLFFGLIVLTWALIQTSALLSGAWKNDIWAIAATTLHHSLAGTISINPWRSITEIIILATYLGILTLAFLFSLKDDLAKKMLSAIIAITAAYGAYALALRLFGFLQYQIFYSTPPVTTGFLSGPFVLHNSYATFAGLGSLAAIVKLISAASVELRGAQDIRQWFLCVVRFLSGSGARFVIAFVLTFSTLVASASRAGFLATVGAMLAMVIATVVVQRRRPVTRWSVGIVLLLTIGLMAINGDTLFSRFNELVDAGTIDDVRSTLWAAASRMIYAKPFLGFGLGTFQDTYPQFANRVLPYTIDKVHNDYLELAVGLGLAAAIACWIILVSLAFRCLRGMHSRRRYHQYATLGFGSCVLVAFHSLFDFSLQIPAVSALFASLLGMGLAQSLSSRFRQW